MTVIYSSSVATHTSEPDKLAKVLVNLIDFLITKKLPLMANFSDK